MGTTTTKEMRQPDLFRGLDRQYRASKLDVQRLVVVQREWSVNVPQRAVRRAGIFEEKLALGVMNLGVDGRYRAVLKHEITLRGSADHQWSVDVILQQHFITELVPRR